MHHHNYTVTDMCNTTCAMLTENGVTISQREEKPYRAYHQDRRTLTLHGTYQGRDIFLDVQFDNARGAFDGYCAIDIDTTDLDKFCDEEYGYPLGAFCDTCIDDYGICRPEHIVSTVINHFNLNS